MPALVKKLNQTLRGWGNYHRHVVASETFARIDKYVRSNCGGCCGTANPGSPNVSCSGSTGQPRRTAYLHGQGKTAKGPRVYTVIRLGDLPSGRYIKIPKDANPYQPEYARLFWERRHKKERWMMSYLSARQYRAQRAEDEQLGLPHKGAL